jgi:hypothetical protein
VQSNLLHSQVVLALGLISSAALFASEVTYRVWLARRRSETIYTNLVAPTTPLDEEELVARPDMKAKLEKIVSSPASF